METENKMEMETATEKEFEFIYSSRNQKTRKVKKKLIFTVFNVVKQKSKKS